MASKSNKVAIMKCQLIQDNTNITWRQYQGNSYNTNWYELTSTRLSLLYKENISHGIQNNDSNTNTYNTSPNKRNYFELSRNIYCTREKLTSAWFHWWCHHATDVWPVRPVTCQWAGQKTRAHDCDISATIVKDRSYWYLKSITSVNIF